MIDLPPPSYGQTIDAIALCGIPRANIRIAYEDLLQSDEITISDLGALEDKKLGCLKAAVHPSYILTIQDEDQRAAFYEFSRRAGRPDELAKAREWVAAKGLTDRVPSFDPQRGVNVFALDLESACDLERGSAVIALGETSLTIRSSFVKQSDLGKSADRLECLMNIFAASDATEKGISFAFVGNEAISEEEKK